MGVLRHYKKNPQNQFEPIPQSLTLAANEGPLSKVEEITQVGAGGKEEYNTTFQKNLNQDSETCSRAQYHSQAISFIW